MIDASSGAVTLTGGRMTEGVVLVDNSVRRPASVASEFVAALLKLFAQKKFDGAPRYLGQFDGMDIFSYLPGEVPARFRTWSDEQVAAAGSLLRAMHDATRGSELAGRCSVVCHHDVGPNNAVFQDDKPVAFIDWDTAAPGSPLEDLGYMAWTWCISSKQDAPVQKQAAQVRILADAYGLDRSERDVVVDCVLERQARNARFWAELLAVPGAAPASTEVIGGRIAWSRREHAFTHAHREVFDRALA
ncbi:phosphotransferase family protein [Streptosporangium lutulentum]|uniref:Ser/Thr protein kinase RdoA (MazF antagonist) n=1 Tax=Streptosporangium lutulentum TaxID=1461250 RepID=A0ABT9QUK3_9ACTN|nr:phosphotransferase [Streptosporangium lutulentum]MDP9850442.1 Ser/Thr protein kinase RdoA (MazF antagonist) [Streptosporangium lutulentum]